MKARNSRLLAGLAALATFVAGLTIGLVIETSVGIASFFNVQDGNRGKDDAVIEIKSTQSLSSTSIGFTKVARIQTAQSLRRNSSPNVPRQYYIAREANDQQGKKSHVTTVLNTIPDSMVLLDQKLLWCPNAEAGTTSMYDSVLFPTNIIPGKERCIASCNVSAWKMFDNGEESQELVIDAPSFTIVRNPWDRLRSCYLSKIVSKKIVPTDDDPKGEKSTHNPNIEAMSFGEFVTHVEKHPNANIHWEPHSSRCLATPNENGHIFHYDHVIKLEDGLFPQIQELFELYRLPFPTGQMKKKNISKGEDTRLYNTQLSDFYLQAADFDVASMHELVKRIGKIYEYDVASHNYSFPEHKWNVAHSDYSSVGPLMSILAEGCSGSSATTKFVKQILRAHGIKVAETNNSELLKPEKNGYYAMALEEFKRKGVEAPNNDQVIVEAMKRYAGAAASKNELLVFKSLGKVDDEKEVMKSLKQINTSYGHIYRRNVLDRTICNIRDCFSEEAGFPVSSINGTWEKTDLCFKRRGSHESVKVHLNVQEAIKAMRKQEERTSKKIELYSQTIWPSRSVATEDLFAFEYTGDEDVFVQSVDSWIELLLFTGLQLDKDVIAKTLRPYQNSRNLELHSRVVQNIDELVPALAAANLSSYLRVSD